MLSKAKKNLKELYRHSFCAINLLWRIETDTLRMQSMRLVSYHTFHHNIDPNDVRHPQSNNFSLFCGTVSVIESGTVDDLDLRVVT